ncbi:MAG TPA: dual specificity protein phosphatase family protein [Candidatus Udaeobacter sp.]|jgi:protein-tyrosine phosphatase|nr:dual specificity protein phosphatase family protein [Candidatus Udaeobacter sp.]
MNITPIDDDSLLYVSSTIDDWGVLQELAISVVIDLEGAVDEGIPTRPGGILYVYLPISDSELPDLAVLGASADLIARLLRSGYRVLIHCGLGLNRSPLLAGMALSRLGWSGPAAVERLRERRPGALFNETYCDFLMNLDQQATE